MNPPEIPQDGTGDDGEWRTSKCCHMDIATGILRAIPDLSTDNTLGFCISQRPWKPRSGKHVFTVEMLSNEVDTEFAIGMVTNKEMEDTEEWMFESLECGLSYQFYLGPSADRGKVTDPDGIYCFEKGEKIRMVPIQWRRFKLEEQDKVSLVVDTDRNTMHFGSRGLEFRYTDEVSKEELCIEALEWYPAIVFCMESKGKATKCRVVDLY